MKAPVQNQNFVISGRSSMDMRDLPVTETVNYTKTCIGIMTVSGFSRSVRQRCSACPA